MSVAEKKTLEELVKEFLPLIDRYVNKFKHVCYRTAFLDEDDLTSAGMIGLLEAYRKYDPSKNVKFKTFAEFRIKGAIIDEIRKAYPRARNVKRQKLRRQVKKLSEKLKRRPERCEIARAMNLSLDEFEKYRREAQSPTVVSLEELNGFSFARSRSFSDESSESVLGAFDGNGEAEELSVKLYGVEEDFFKVRSQKETFLCMKRAMERLRDRERAVLFMYHYEGFKKKEIARILGCTKSNVSKMHRDAISKLKEEMSKMGAL